MWALNNRTPYKVEACWGRDSNGVHEWLVAVKGTFEIDSDGSVSLADEQMPPLLLPEYHGEAGTSSLRYDADVVAMKPATDVILNGTAYAPKGIPSTDFSISLRVHDIYKELRVLGNRRWRRGILGITPSAAEAIVDLPVRYEHAFGGYDRTHEDPKHQRMEARNPVGRGVATRSEHLIDQFLPNFAYPGKKPEESAPAGFGAIDSFWSPRRELSGTYDSAWEENRSPLLPEDWDSRSLLCSPPDQRPESYLRGGERVELHHLTRNGVLRFELPKVFLTFSTYFSGDVTEHRSRLTTVVIEPDAPRVIMVWLSSLICRQDIDYLDTTIVAEKEYL